METKEKIDFSSIRICGILSYESGYGFDFRKSIREQVE